MRGCPFPPLVDCQGV
ncbi:unnamed protein product [Gulo gulo]|uniref:Uncharacterized protein n=1 Tax=Gulo gulo TaxID=48420 RepID=A0A9X9LMD5_GULGU|nr:unnamed protein product [Gulo gulo]